MLTPFYLTKLCCIICSLFGMVSYLISEGDLVTIMPILSKRSSLNSPLKRSMKLINTFFQGAIFVLVLFYSTKIKNPTL